MGFYRRRFRSLSCLLLAFLFLAFRGIAPARGADTREPIHPQLTRWKLESTKLSPADKGGAEGDAAVTSDRYDVQLYDIDLRIDPAAGSISGAVQLNFVSSYEGLQTFVLDLSSDLAVQSVSHLTGMLPHTHSGDSLVITLPGNMSLGEADSLTVHYQGLPSEPAFNRGLVYRTYNLAGHSGVSVANLSQPAYAKYWWPCKDRPDDKALSRMAITVPEGLVGVSNGNLLGTSNPEAGWITYFWQEDYPIASYLISVAVADYVRLDDHCSTVRGSEIPLHHWVFPPDESDAVVDFAPVCEMMDVCESSFGPYPFQGEKYGHAEFMWNGAMEHQTATSIGYGSILGDGSRDWLIVHELGHQWFGDSLTPHSWADIWLNEGFATYTEALWDEHLAGEGAYLANLHRSRQPGIWALQGPVYDPVPVFPGRVIYDKGAWILHMLRGRLRAATGTDDDFFTLLENWAQTGGRPGSTVTTEEFIALAEQAAGEPLGDFFWPYLTSLEIPRIAFSFGLNAGTNGPSSLVELDLRQQQSPLFDNYFPVLINTVAGSETHFVRLDQTATQVSIQAAAEVTTVSLDPYGWVLWDPAQTPDQSAGLTGAYPNPSSDGYVYLTFNLDSPGNISLGIYDAMGREIDRLNPGWVEPDAEGNSLVWDQQDSQGRPVASGAYWAVMEIGDQRSVRAFTVVR